MALTVVKPSDNQRDIPEPRDVPEPLVISSSTQTDGSLFTDTIVLKNCSLHVRGSVSGSLTIEPGAEVFVDGSVHGRILNRGGRVVINHKALTACVVGEGPPENETGAALTINLSAIAFNWERLANNTDAECAAVLECNAYGCGIERVADALAKSGCQTFFVTNLAEARRVRAAAPDSTIYVLQGLHADAAPIFAELDAQPVINSTLQLAEWNTFLCSNRWTGGCALSVDTGVNGLGLSMEEAVELPARVSVAKHGITLLMSSMVGVEQTHHTQRDRQIARFSELRRLYHGIPASLAGASAILLNPNSHFDLVRADSALFGINPAPGSANPMLPVVELRARIVQVRNTTPGRSFIDAEAKGRRLAWISIGRADGFPCSWHPKTKLYAIVDGHRCPVITPSSLDLLAIDVTDLPDGKVAESGEMATLIGATITIDEIAEAIRSTEQEVLTALGSNLRRIYYVT